MRWLRDSAARFAGAVQYLTVLRFGSLLPFAALRVPYEEAVGFLPLVGGLVGMLSGLALWALIQLPLSQGLSAALVLVAFTFLGGFRQETGLMGLSLDVGARGDLPSLAFSGKPARKVVAATATGVTLILCSLLIRWQALSVLAGGQLWFLLAATLSAGLLSRASLIFLAASAKPLGSGKAAAFIGKVPGWMLLATGLQASVAVSLLGWQGTVPLVLGGVSLILSLRLWFLLRIGGVNGHCLCACSAAVECLVLVVAAWRHSF